MLPVTTDTIRIFLHVLAATVWVGGQLTLTALLPVLRAAGGDVPKQAARAFNRVAWAAFAVLVVTGGWNIAAVGDDTSDSYKTTLYVKLGFVALSGIAAGWHAVTKSRPVLAATGAVGGLSALIALFMGIMLR
ncbi:hypothetical protein [Actinomadura gamaensis]|uniref:Copper resistance protein D domain-containing protein n=1 Tax=Actinomadura gamaensis TaxID=1763541 RepID=A0ABV9UAB0_9ACTN